MKKRNIIIILSIILLVILDQLTKFLVVKLIPLNNAVILIRNFLKFYYIQNTGAAFGMFSGYLILLIIITFVVLYFLYKEIKTSKIDNLNICSLVLIISGSIGNLIDRVFRKYVIDFISFTLFKHEMAIFNVADIYITIGVIIYLLGILRERNYERNSSKK